MRRPYQSPGFTLIEVMIVLAIASVLLGVIFLAVKPANEKQRDTQRKDSAGKLIAAFESYAGTNGNDYSGFNCTTYCKEIKDPDSPTGHPVQGSPGVAATKSSGIIYVVGGVCATGVDAGSATTAPAGNRAYSILYWSEGSTTSQCIDNQGQKTGGTGGSAAFGSGGSSTYSQNGGAYSSCQPSPDKCLSYSGGAAYTAWSPTQFVYNVDNVSDGTNTVKIVYKNSTPLPSSYPAFKVNLYANGVKVMSNLSLPVNSDGNAPEPFVTNLNLASNTNSVGVEWTNDWCCADVDGVHMDANFVLMSLSVTR